MRIGVTGAGGFIGTHLCFSLASAGHSVLALDDLSHGVDSFSGKDLRRIRFHEIDVSKSPDEIRSLFEDFRTDAVCHLADASLASPAWDTCMFGRYVDALVNTMSASIAIGVQKFVYASSADYLFGRQCEMPVRDTMKSRPANLYGVHKHNCECIVTHMAAASRLRWAVVRLPYVYGASARHLAKKARKGYCFISDALKRRGRPVIRIPGDGNQTRDFLWVGDAVAALEAAIQDRGLVGVANAGTEIETPVRKVLERIEELTGRKARVEYLYKKKDDVPRSQVSATTMREHRWRPKTGIAHGLENLAENGIKAIYEGDGA